MMPCTPILEPYDTAWDRSRRLCWEQSAALRLSGRPAPSGSRLHGCFANDVGRITRAGMIASPEPGDGEGTGAGDQQDGCQQGPIVAVETAIRRPLAGEEQADDDRPGDDRRFCDAQRRPPGRLPQVWGRVA